MVGQHIRALKDGRWIHAIDCGDETVIHLAEDAAPRRVRRAYRPEFVAGAESVEHVTHRERTFPPKEIVRRAYSRAADPTLASMFRDSEAFAAWCATGRSWAPRNFAVHVPAAGAAREAPADPDSRSIARPSKRPSARRTASRRPAKRVSPKGSARGASARKAKAKAGAKRTVRARKRPAARTSSTKRTAKPARRRRSRR